MKFLVQFTIKSTGELVVQNRLYETRKEAEYWKRECEMWDTRNLLKFEVVEID